MIYVIIINSIPIIIIIIIIISTIIGSAADAAQHGERPDRAGPLRRGPRRSPGRALHASSSTQTMGICVSRSP